MSQGPTFEFRLRRAIAGCYGTNNLALYERVILNLIELVQHNASQLGNIVTQDEAFNTLKETSVFELFEPEIGDSDE